MSPVRIGDVVKVGQGKALWRITGFWTHGAERLAELQRVDREWVRSSSVVNRLERVEMQP